MARLVNGNKYLVQPIQILPVDPKQILRLSTGMMPNANITAEEVLASTAHLDFPAPSPALDFLVAILLRHVPLEGAGKLLREESIENMNPRAATQDTEVFSYHSRPGLSRSSKSKQNAVPTSQKLHTHKDPFPAPK